MDTPQPIDINRLKKMLGGAKAIMNKVESGDFQTGNIDNSVLALGDQLVEHAPNGRTSQSGRSAAPQIRDGEAYYPNLEKSKLPAAIKEAMLKTPIPQINGFPQTFTLDEVMGFENDEKSIPPPPTPKTKQRVNETIQSNVKMNDIEIRKIIKEEMRNIVQEEMIEFFTKYFAKSLAEETQKKLIHHLLKEGKLNLKK